MRIIFSRKGFDSTAGGAPSPIVDGRPISLPIPAADCSRATYAGLGLGDLVERATRGRIGRDRLCHEDPMFLDDRGRCLFGQCDIAQGHLRKQGVGPGDCFLFFGLYAGEESGERHHRIFGYLQIEEVLSPVPRDPGPLPRPHPHMIGDWPANNTLYRGEGIRARHASPELRLTRPGGPLTHWHVPPWLHRFGLSYHDQPWRWPAPGELIAAPRGQEFVTDIGDDPEALLWLQRIVAAIRA